MPCSGLGTEARAAQAKLPGGRVGPRSHVRKLQARHRLGFPSPIHSPLASGVGRAACLTLLFLQLVVIGGTTSWTGHGGGGQGSGRGGDLRMRAKERRGSCWAFASVTPRRRTPRSQRRTQHRAPDNVGGGEASPVPRPAPPRKASLFRSLGWEGRPLPRRRMPCRLCGALVFAALLTPPAPWPPALQAPTPAGGGGSLGGAGEGGERGPGPLFREEGTDFSSGSGASRSPRLPAPRLPEQTLSTLFGDRETTLHVWP